MLVSVYQGTALAGHLQIAVKGSMTEIGYFGVFGGKGSSTVMKADVKSNAKVMQTLTDRKTRGSRFVSTQPWPTNPYYTPRPAVYTTTMGTVEWGYTGDEKVNFGDSRHVVVRTLHQKHVTGLVTLNSSVANTVPEHQCRLSIRRSIAFP